MQAAHQIVSQKPYWLFSRNVDLSIFLGSAVASLLLLALGWRLGILNEDSPEWTWVSAVLLIDVAHVWTTTFRVYFDAAEVRRHLALYLLVPALGYIFGVALYSEGELVFWRVLAVIAIFHFVRQQYGWMALYRRRAGETDKWSWCIDTLAIYMATVYPLAFWVTSLPRHFSWFVDNDLLPLPAIVERILFPLYLLSLAAYFSRSIYLYFAKGIASPGKDILVATTAICWYAGIVAFNSDYAFTVTNVIIHGVPYFALIWIYAKNRRENAGRFYRGISSHWIFFLATVWAFAYIEELFWHRGVWHEREWLFGSDWDWTGLKLYLVPLLAVPQLTHYVLDGFIWRRSHGSEVKIF